MSEDDTKEPNIKMCVFFLFFLQGKWKSTHSDPITLKELHPVSSSLDYNIKRFCLPTLTLISLVHSNQLLSPLFRTVCPNLQFIEKFKKKIKSWILTCNTMHSQGKGLLASLKERIVNQVFLPSSFSSFSCLSPVGGQPASSRTWNGAMWQRGLGAVTPLSPLHHLDSSLSPQQLIVPPSPNLLPLSPLWALDKATTAATWRTRWSTR